jgi:hypothetical protein
VAPEQQRAGLFSDGRLQGDPDTASILKTLDPEPIRPMDELLAILRDMKDKYQDLVIDDEHDDGMDVNKALDVMRLSTILPGLLTL